MTTSFPAQTVTTSELEGPIARCGQLAYMALSGSSVLPPFSTVVSTSVSSGMGARLVDLQLDSSDPELPSVLRSFNSGRGADVVLNAAGGPLFAIGLSVLAHRGRQVEITSPSERRVSIDLVDFYHNESQLLGVDTLKRDLTATARILEMLRPGFDTGAYIPPMIADTVSLSLARRAYERVAKGERGRVVLKPR
jgi:NADPH:quinone reductase